MKFKNGLESDTRDLFGVTEMFYWGGSCKHVLICLNTSNITFKSDQFAVFKLHFNKIKFKKKITCKHMK